MSNLNGIHRKALRRGLTRPRYEIIPMRGALEAARLLPAGTTVTVTCSPNRGVEATVDLALQLHARGYTAVPHLAARRFASRAHLEDTASRLTEAGVDDVFVVGGDGTPDGSDQAGPFANGADLIRALAEIRPDIRSVGIPCYPEGHAFIAAEALDQALEDKCFFAGHMVTQICFDADTIRVWLERIRARGIGIPTYIGIPGVVERHKLLGIALRIGLGDSTRFLRKNAGFVRHLAGGSSYTPDALVEGLARMMGNAALGIAGFHINSFNQVAATEAWRRDWLESLADVADIEADDVAAFGSSAS